MDLIGSQKPDGILDRPVFIVGMPRSGTTLLGMMLSASSKLSISPETKYFTKYWRQCESNNCLENRGKYVEFLHVLLSGPEIKDLGLPASLQEQMWQKLNELSEPTHAEIFSSILTAYAEASGKARCGEKTPAHLIYVPLLASYYPEAKFVYIERDPRGVSSSLASMSWSMGNSFNHALRWRWYSKLAERFTNEKYPLKRVQFERLLESPEDVLRQVCAFIEVPYEQAMVTHFHKSRPIFNPQKEPWKKGSLTPINPSKIFEWKTKINTSDQLIVELIVGNRMIDHGYSLSSEHPSTSVILEMMWIILLGLWNEIRNLRIDPRGKIRRWLSGGERMELNDSAK